MPPSCPNDNHSSDKNCNFQHPFSDPEEVKNAEYMFTETEIMSSLLRLEQQEKDFLNSTTNSHITLSLLIH